MEIEYSIIFKNMRNFYLFVAIALALASVAHTAIIITSSLPKIYQISSTQTLIVFDEPTASSPSPPAVSHADSEVTVPVGSSSANSSENVSVQAIRTNSVNANS
jgi:hypothetical protein